MYKYLFYDCILCWTRTCMKCRQWQYPELSNDLFIFQSFILIDYFLYSNSDIFSQYQISLCRLVSIHWTQIFYSIFRTSLTNFYSTLNIFIVINKFLLEFKQFYTLWKFFIDSNIFNKLLFKFKWFFFSNSNILIFIDKIFFEFKYSEAVVGRCSSK